MNKGDNDEEMREQYDFSQAVRGKHHAKYREGSNVVLLEPDVAEVFRDSASVNQALRLLLELAENEVGRNRAGGSKG